MAAYYMVTRVVLVTCIKEWVSNNFFGKADKLPLLGALSSISSNAYGIVDGNACKLRLAR